MGVSLMILWTRSSSYLAVCVLVLQSEMYLVGMYFALCIGSLCCARLFGRQTLCEGGGDGSVCKPGCGGAVEDA